MFEGRYTLVSVRRLLSRGLVQPRAQHDPTRFRGLSHAYMVDNTEDTNHCLGRHLQHPKGLLEYRIPLIRKYKQHVGSDMNIKRSLYSLCR